MPVIQKPQACALCPIFDHYDQRGFVPPWGRGTSGLAVVGEAGGEHEWLQGRPFVEFAPAGALLERIIRRTGLEMEEDPIRQLGAWPHLTREQLRIWNVANCRPKNNWLEGAPWESGAVAHCQVHRDREVQENRPKAILALGNTALRALTTMSGPKRSIGLLRGYVIPAAEYNLPDGSPIPVIPSLHPSFLRRGAIHQLISSYWDMRRALWVVKHGHQWVKPKDHLRKDYPNSDKPATREELKAFITYCRQHPEHPVFYDIETPWSADEMEDKLEAARKEYNDDLIESVQFWHKGRGVFIDTTGTPFALLDKQERNQFGEFKDLIQEVFDLPNPKAGFNVYLFDDPILMAAGIKMPPYGSDRHDLMWMWHHTQPDLDANLQFAASFLPWPFPWKHLAGSEKGIYALCDVAVLEHMWDVLPGQMKRDGIWRGYERHVARLRRDLYGAELKGVPVDADAHKELERTIGEERERTFAEIQEMVPEELKGLHPRQGYKVLPKPIKAVIKQRLKDEAPILEDQSVRESLLSAFALELAPPLIPGDAKKRTGEWFFHKFVQPFEDVPVEGIRVWRLCIRKPFLPSSSDQVKAYIRFRKHQMPKKFKTGEDTTEKKELERLAKKYKDPFYDKILEFRLYDKYYGTYVVGWKPQMTEGEERWGRVHGKFTYRPATGQLSSIDPNLQNSPKHGELAKAWNAMIAVKPGRRIVELDFSAFHVLTTGFEAGDLLYMRMARIDPHSFLASHFKSVDFPPIDPKWSDDEIALATAEVKERFPHERNKMAKPGILGYGFGLGINNFFHQNSEAFGGEMKRVREVFDLLDNLFPLARRWRGAIRLKAHNDGRLISKHGYVRYFTEVLTWDPNKKIWKPGEHSEQAIAFLPANDAFGHIKDVTIKLGDQGLNEKFGFFNQIHDNLCFDVADEHFDDLIETVPHLMRAKSEVLISKEVPDGLWCGVEVEVGMTRASLKTIMKTTYKGELVST